MSSEVVENHKRKEKLQLEVEATKNTFEESNDESEAICDEERDNSFAGLSTEKYQNVPIPSPLVLSHQNSQLH